TSSTDSLTFTKGNDINIVATQQNFTENGGNLEGNTTSSVKLIANNDTKTATKYYSLSLDVTKNGYIYTSGTTPELMMTVTDPSGALVTAIDGLNYTTSGGITGFDITTRQETIYIKNNKEITTTNYTTGFTENWTIKVYFINLNSNQYENSSKLFTGTVNINANEEKYLTTNNNNLYLANANKSVINKLKVYGSSLQNGTPTPTVPVPVNSLGEKTGLNITVENNKFINGFGELKDNTNFAPYTYKTDETSSTGSSFCFSSSTSLNHFLGDYVEVDPTKSYTLSADFKASNNVSTFYAGLIEYDIDKNGIGAQNVMYIANTLTYLTKDLNNGDTVVYLNDITNWLNLSSTYSHQLGFIFWNYQDSTGYKYPEFTYSRNVWLDLFNYNDINKENNTITLKKAWNYGSISKNTKLSQSNAGSSYNYGLIGGSKLTNNWQAKSLAIANTNTSDFLNFNKFRAGSKYVKFLILFNYNSTPNTTLDISNIAIRETNEKETLNIKESLRCIDKVCDYLDLENKRIVRNIGSVIYDGAEYWNFVQNNDSSWGSLYLNQGNSKMSNLNRNTSNDKFICSHYPYILSNEGSYRYRNTLGIMGYSDPSAAFMITSPTSVASSSASFKTFLANQSTNGTPLTMLYKYSSSVYEPITLPNINTFNGTNKITISDGTMNPS
ncbi:MAG: hypothetical protein RR478_05445, partial [Bacilli bacterium]